MISTTDVPAEGFPLRTGPVYGQPVAPQVGGGGGAGEAGGSWREGRGLEDDHCSLTDPV